MITQLTCILASILIESANAHNPCHSECEPFKCHGPKKRNFNDCGVNMYRIGDLCYCLPGFFDNGGRCNDYTPFCIERMYNGTAWICQKCESLRDVLLTNGTCTRSTNNATFFVRANLIYTGTSQNKADIDYFYWNRCKSSLDTAGKCLECYPNAFVNATKVCQIPLSDKCTVIDPAITAKCLVANIGFYIDQATGVFSHVLLIASCKSCFGPGMYDCYSCLKYFYCVASPNLESGMCARCHYGCKSCTGPSAVDCTDVNSGYYIERSDPGTLNMVKACQTGCDYCVSGTNCTHCKGLNKH